MKRNLELASLTILLAAAVMLALTAACSQPANESKDNSASFNLDDPAPEKPIEPGLDIVGKSPEEIWQVRCGQCHTYERGLDRYKGDQWEPIIQRMMKKPGALLNTSLARIIFIYLWERTTGEKHPDREEVLNAPINTAGMGNAVGGD